MPRTAPGSSLMATAGTGNVLASRLIHRAHAETVRYLYAPACALVEADYEQAPDGIHRRKVTGRPVGCRAQTVRRSG
ncbi:hypothetical protein [Streptomyces sp. NPDC090025]|uniref:hypothetical protein n=1 Tax=Streptomyces sp. NPDC090025 TaxID=3365922 RepID=UPI003835C281